MRIYDTDGLPGELIYDIRGEGADAVGDWVEPWEERMIRKFGDISRGIPRNDNEEQGDNNAHAHEVLKESLV
jgi:hypothetical protein